MAGIVREDGARYRRLYNYPLQFARLSSEQQYWCRGEGKWKMSD